LCAIAFGVCAAVFEILVQFYENRNWETAFFNVIPKRKGALHKMSVIASDTTVITPVDTTSTLADAEAGKQTLEVSTEVKVVNTLTSDTCGVKVKQDSSNGQCDNDSNDTNLDGDKKL
jgi:hypothetical protein